MGPLQPERVDDAAHELGGNGPELVFPPVDGGTQTTAGPVEQDAAIASQLAHEWSECHRRPQAAMGEHDRLTRSDLLDPQANRGRLELNEPLGRFKSVVAPHRALRTSIALGPLVGGIHVRLLGWSSHSSR